MKKSITCALFLIMFSLTSFSQNEKDYKELLSPLNLVSCKNCVDVNPEFDFKGNNKLQKLRMDFKKVTNNSFLPIEFKVDANGIIENVIIFNTFLPKPILKNREAKINNFLSQFVGMKVIKKSAKKNNVAVSFKTVLSLLVINNKLTLDPITH